MATRRSGKRTSIRKKGEEVLTISEPPSTPINSTKAAMPNSTKKVKVLYDVSHLVHVTMRADVTQARATEISSVSNTSEC